MEIDQFNRNAVEDREAPTDYSSPSNAKYYRVSGTEPNIEILPIRNILIDDGVRVILYQLNKAFGSSIYNPLNETLERLQQLDINLSELYRSFKSNLPLSPIEVRETVVINNPSPSYPDSPATVGLGAPLINKYPISTDFLYKVIEGNDKLALSIYFGYDHIPIITRV